MLINCAAYQDGTKLADLPIEQIGGHLNRPGSFVWVALRDATAAELDQMRREFNLHELAVEDAQKGHQRPKLDEYGDSVFVVTHLIESAPRPAEPAVPRGNLSSPAKPDLLRSTADELQVGEVACSSVPTTWCRCATTAHSTSWACANAASASRIFSSKGPASCCMR